MLASSGRASSVCCKTSTRASTSARALFMSLPVAIFIGCAIAGNGRDMEWIAHDLAVDDHDRMHIEQFGNHRAIEPPEAVLAELGKMVGQQQFVDAPFVFDQAFGAGNVM